jgi:hypothetical protein
MKLKKTLITVSAVVTLVVGCTFVLANNSSNNTNVITQYNIYDDDYDVNDLAWNGWKGDYCSECFG